MLIREVALSLSIGMAVLLSGCEGNASTPASAPAPATKNTSPALASAIPAATSASSASASAPAATATETRSTPASAPALVTRYFSAADGSCKITLTCPADWNVKEDAKWLGRMIKGGEKVSDFEGEWHCAVKMVAATWTVDLLVNQLSEIMTRDPDTKLQEKKVETRTDGKSAGIIVTRRTSLGGVFVQRDYFYRVDERSILAITEIATSNRWTQQSEGLAQITASVVAETR